MHVTGVKESPHDQRVIGDDAIHTHRDKAASQLSIVDGVHPDLEPTFMGLAYRRRIHLLPQEHFDDVDLRWCEPQWTVSPRRGFDDLGS